MLKGENFEIKSASGVENFGFITTRFVKAKTPEEAELIAVNMVWKDSNLLENLYKESTLEPKIYLEEMWAVCWWKRLGGRGYTFYPMVSEE